MLGSRLGHYIITDKLGEGGMGVVYQARDTHLDRLVAIKLLPDDKLADPDRKRRFIQEARTASALNHPNIITIHDVAEADGVQFIVMEYVAGKTLDHVVGRKGLPVPLVLKHAIQIADALAAAHAAGIIHRDIKPGNIMVTERGTIKVLDFGLAKLIEHEPERDVTRTIGQVEERPKSEEGKILGTVAYMAPEQAEGGHADARSDIFAFGAVLFEMLTGRSPFQRSSKLSTLSAILREDPGPAVALAEYVPPELDRIIARCLRKDPDYRFQHMADLRVALWELKQESDSGKLSLPGTPEMRRSGFPKWAAAAIGFLAILAASAVVYYRARHAAPVAQSRMTRLTFDSGLSFYPALSPDGSLLAFASDRSGEGNLDIWVKQIAGGNPIRLTSDPADDSEPAFSPDGASIVFRSERQGGGLYVMPALGGDARKIADGGHNPHFSPDGKWVAYWMNAALGNSAVAAFLVPAAGGPPRRIAPDFMWASVPVWAGDAKHLLFQGRSQGVGDWYVTTVTGDRPVQSHIADALKEIGGSGFMGIVGSATSLPVIIGTAEGRPRMLLAASTGDSANLWEIPLSPKNWQPAGEPQRLTFGAGVEAFPAASGNGRIVFANITSNTDLWQAPLEAGNGKAGAPPVRLTSNAVVSFFPSLSADGKSLGFLSARSGNTEIWAKDLASGKDRPLTSDGVRKNRPLITPDGSSITYSSLNGLQSVPLAGGQPETICAKCGMPWGWSPDGKLLLHFRAFNASGLLDIRDGSDSEILKHPKYSLHALRFSPDARWISFHAGTGVNTRRIYVAPFHGATSIPESDWIPITGGKGLDREPRWSPDGNLLYFLSTRDGYNCIWAQRLDSGKRSAGEPWPVLHLHAARSNLNVNDTGPIGLSIAPGRLVFAMAETTGNIWMLQ